jgi:predicted GNAT family acetyltransferase
MFYLISSEIKISKTAIPQGFKKIGFAIKFCQKDIVSFDSCAQWGVHPTANGQTAF